MYLAQLPRTPGVRLTAIADLDPARAEPRSNAWAGAARRSARCVSSTTRVG
jgi:hypothetical protein